MLRYATRAKSTVLLDFLAPSLILHRASTSATTRLHKSPHTTRRDFLFDPVIPSRNPNKEIHQVVQEQGLSDHDVELFNATVTRLRRALKNDRDIRAAWKEWSVLQQRKLLHFLGPPQLEVFSDLLANLCPLNAPREWDEEQRTATEEIALVVAAGGATEALYTCMVAHIQDGDPETVLELYSRYLQLREGKEGLCVREAAVDEQDQSEDELAPVLTEESSRKSSESVSIILPVIAAHTMRDSFKAAFEASLQTNIRKHHWTTVEFLKHLSTNPALQLQVETYIHRVETARLLMRPLALSRQISNLARDQAVVPLEKLYNAILAGLTGTDGYLVASASSVTSARPVFIPEICWTSFLTAFLQCRRFELANRLWDDMIKASVHPSTTVWTALFNGYDSIGAVDEAIAGWESMISHKIRPDGLTYRAFISALFNGNRPDKATEAFKAFQQELAKRSSVMEESQVLAVYNTALHGLLTISQDAAASAIMQTMLEKGPKPDIVTYNTFLQCHSRRGNFKALATVLRDLTSAGLTGDVFTFSTILSALLKAGREDATEATLKLMRKQGVEPNVATYSAIIDHLMRERDEKGLRGALNLLRKMEGTPGAEPNEVTYTAILSSVYRGNWLHPQVVTECTQYIWGKMQARRIQPTRATYNILLKACLRNPEPAGLQNALSLYRDMKKRVRLTDDSWYLLLHGLVEREEWAMANEMVMDMKQSGHQPKQGVLDLMIRIRNRSSKKRRPRPGL